MNIKLIATLAAGVALAGCATKTPPAEQATVDLQNDGIAKTCTPSAVDLSTPTPATIAMTNDGWCGVFTADKDGQPFSLGLVKTRPSHGRVYIQPIGRQTRVEYTPNNGYVGADTFAVSLRSRTAGVADSALTVNVAVAQGERPAVIAPPPATTTRKPPPPTRNPARKRSTNR